MLHLDEAHERLIENLAAFLRGKSGSWRVLLVQDVLASHRLVLWCPTTMREAALRELDRRLAEAGGAYWSGHVLEGQGPSEIPDGAWQREAWSQARRVGDGAVSLRVLDRHLAKAGWFDAPDDPPWRLGRRRRSGAAICAFYSFKGGVGRSTALAATALQFAARGDRVAVLDVDLDSPGVGSLLHGHDGVVADVGLVDYLLEAPLVGKAGGCRLADYHHRCPPDLHRGRGEILVFPAGRMNRRYIEKLARLDYGANSTERSRHPFVALLEQIRAELDPQWILVDARAGLGEVSGFLTGGLCHLYVLFGTLAEASWRGLELVLDRLGGQRLRSLGSQCECFLAAAMIPRLQEERYERSVAAFTDRASDVFSASYYAESGERDSAWTVDDVANSSDAPHVPTGLAYDARLALFVDLEEVASSVLLQSGSPYEELADRIRMSTEQLREAGR